MIVDWRRQARQAQRRGGKERSEGGGREEKRGGGKEGKEDGGAEESCFLPERNEVGDVCKMSW